MKTFKQRGCSVRNALLKRFPRGFLRALGILKHLRHRLPSALCRELEQNLRLAFPLKTGPQIARLARSVLVTNLVEGADQFRLSLLAKEDLCKEISSIRVKGSEHLENALAAGRGVVLVSPHYGDFMQAALRVAIGPFTKPVHFFYNPSERNAYADTSDTLIDRVDGHCVKIHNDRKGVITALRALKNGGILCFMPDQITQEGETIHVPFFGRFFGVMKGAAFFALKGNAQIIPIYCSVGEDGTRTMEYRPPIEVTTDPSLEEEGQIYQMSAALFKETERQFRLAPAHWRYWMQYRSRSFISPFPAESRAQMATQLDEIHRRVADQLSTAGVIDEWRSLLRRFEIGAGF